MSVPENETGPNRLVKDYLLPRVPEFKVLMELKQKGWDNPEGDAFFKEQRKRADDADEHTKRNFLSMMIKIGDQLNMTTSALNLATTGDQAPSLLDLCMAPGGFTASVMQRNPRVRVRGISLPSEKGGHDILLDNWKVDPRIQVKFLDITMLSTEFDATDIPVDHPESHSFMTERPFFGEAFDLVFCDGQVLRTHKRLDYREDREAGRLSASQLILALQRVKTGGTLVVLLHKADYWRSVELLHTFSMFACLQLFKPEPMHAKRSSFYLIAKKMQPQSEEALRAVTRWKKSWAVATFGTDEEHGANSKVKLEDVEKVLATFGDELIGLAKPVWEIQSKALRNASFIRNNSRGSGKWR